MQVVLLFCLVALSACLGSSDPKEDGGSPVPSDEFGNSCTSDRMCMSPQVCDRPKEICVFCRVDAECIVGSVCLEGNCFSEPAEPVSVPVVGPRPIVDPEPEPVVEPEPVEPEILACMEWEACCDSLVGTGREAGCYTDFANEDLHPANCDDYRDAYCPPTCDDGVWNGEETDVDCGGPRCSPCPDDSACRLHSDCSGGTCTGLSVCYTITGSPVGGDACGFGAVEIGRIAEYCSKVNLHTDANGDWATDSDCSSGCGKDRVGYCQKYYPATTATVEFPAVGIKPFENASCANYYPAVGEVEIACCVPL